MQQPPVTLDFSNQSHEYIQAMLLNHQIHLSVEEALKIQHLFLKRPPTLTECVLWSIQGSEHCSYKSTRQHLKRFVTEGPHVILGPREDAGIVSVATDDAGKRYGIVISHESHNHPSEIVPYEGAATGVGGNVRDVSCMGAEVIAIADGLRFGSLSLPKTHRLLKGVTDGIAGYGNPLGVPNLTGDVYFNDGYNENCLVTVTTLGVVAESDVIHSYAPPHAEDYVYILVGKPTDHSGFGGAAFASHTLKEAEKESNKSAVQEPNAFLQRHLLKANNALFAWLKKNNAIEKVAFKDLGAGGIACASVEMAEAAGYGAEINLDHVPVNQLLSPTVVLCAETQERFMWLVPPDLVDVVLHHYNHTYALPTVSSGACASVIGKIRNDGQYIVTQGDLTLVNAKAYDITQGMQYTRPCEVEAITHEEPADTAGDCATYLLQILAHENMASRAPIYEKYDKQVQGRTVLERGLANAGVLSPFNEDKYPEEIRLTGIALALAQNPRYNQIDSFWGAVNAVVASAREVVATGATPVAISDCLCFGNPEKPAHMAAFVEAVNGIVAATAAITLKAYPNFTLPVIAGNVSLYNESENSCIPSSPMISCLGVMPNLQKLITPDFKQSGSLIILIGERLDECGGSLYYDCLGVLGANLPKPSLKDIANEMHAVTEAIQQEKVLAAKAIAAGGLLTAVTQMCFKNNVGATLLLNTALPLNKLLFSETGGFVLEISPKALLSIKTIFSDYNVPIFPIGEVKDHAEIRVNDTISLSVKQAKAVWENGLREKLL